MQLNFAIVIVAAAISLQPVALKQIQQKDVIKYNKISKNHRE